MKGKFWAYFAPDGYCQVRSISETKDEARRFIVQDNSSSLTFMDYENAGFKLVRVTLDLRPTD